MHKPRSPKNCQDHKKTKKVDGKASPLEAAERAEPNSHLTYSVPTRSGHFRTVQSPFCMNLGHLHPLHE